MREWLYKPTSSWSHHYLEVSSNGNSDIQTAGEAVSRASLDDMEKNKYLTLLGLELWPLGPLACSLSLCRHKQEEGTLECATPASSQIINSHNGDCRLEYDSY
jgi:hypothetical protein